MKKNLFLLLGICLLSIGTTANADIVDDLSINAAGSIGYIVSSENNFLGETKDGTFEFNELALSTLYQPTGRLSFAAKVASRDMVDVGNNEIMVDYLKARFSFTQYLNVSFGRLLLPSGLYNEIRDMASLKMFAINPQNQYSEGLRDMLAKIDGVGIDGFFGPVYYSMFYSLSDDETIDEANDYEGIAREYSRVIGQDVHKLYWESYAPVKRGAKLEWSNEHWRVGGTYVLTRLETHLVAKRGAIYYDRISVLNTTTRAFYVQYQNPKFRISATSYEYIGATPHTRDTSYKQARLIDGDYTVASGLQVGFLYSPMIYEGEKTEDIALLVKYSRGSFIVQAEHHFINDEMEGGYFAPLDNPEGVEDHGTISTIKFTYLLNIL